jgi:phospholipase C
MTTDRRKFLQMLGTTAAAGAFAAPFTASIRRALAVPAHHRTGTIADVEHIVFLMQENRSFDHYFGTMRGVRGFGDPRAVRLPNGDPVWNQPNGASAVLPFRPSTPDLGLQFLQDLPHNWGDTHRAWNGGKHDQWVPNKGTTTMAHLTREDLPFHYALADAFTICDAYHCSVLGATDPNRYHMWTGWLGNDGQNGGPVLDNAEAGYDWSTFPERLQQAGISWKIYQDIGEGLDAQHFWGFTSNAFIGNFGDNSLLYFHQYQNAQPGSPLFENARRGTNIATAGSLFDILQADVIGNRLPQVSWIVAPEGYSEHGNWPANFGAWYVSHVLDVLTSNPEVFSKTALFLMYDEDDGLFDHMVPPTPPQSRAEGLSTIDVTHEIFPGNARFAAGPIGLGIRVPMIVISPWSKGGWVNSEVFDHTSLIRFVEQRFARDRVRETNITRWRRAVTGDLTSAFDFRRPNDRRVELPSTDRFAPPDTRRHPDFRPAVPAEQVMPRQEPGVRPARALPYELHATSKVDLARRRVTIKFSNTGLAAAVFQVRSGGSTRGPWTYTVGSHDDLVDIWDFAEHNETVYDLSVYGPNGFFRAVKGGLVGVAAHVTVQTIYDTERNIIQLEIHNRGARLRGLHIVDAYARDRTVHEVDPGETLVRRFPLARSFGWYDFALTADSDPGFRYQIAGHLESGCDSMSDPALGG